MKKLAAAKLKLSTETLRQLGEGELGKVAGGTWIINTTKCQTMNCGTYNCVSFACQIYTVNNC